MTRIHSDVDSCISSSKSGYQVSVLVAVPQSLASPVAQTAFVATKQTAPPAARTPHAYGEGRATSAVAPLTIPVRATPSKYGDFVFTFAPHQGDARVLDLQSVAVNQDGSAGSTSWSFTIFVNGAPVSQVPNQSYTDERKPTMYRPIASVPLQGSGSRITILGYKN